MIFVTETGLVMS